MTDISELSGRGLVLVGCGRMGGALLGGWLKSGLAPGAVHVVDPNPRGDLAALGVSVNGELPESPAVLVIAVKPQMMADVLPRLDVGADTLVISVAAGVTLAAYEAAFPGAAIVRTMPNTPAAIGQGITAIVGNARADEGDLASAVDLGKQVLNGPGDGILGRVRGVAVGGAALDLVPARLHDVPGLGAAGRKRLVDGFP